MDIATLKVKLQSLRQAWTESSTQEKLVSVGVCVTGYLTLRKLFDVLYRKWYKLPNGGIGIPYFGSFLRYYYGNEYKWLMKLGIQYPIVSMVYFNSNPVIIINDYDLATQLFSKNEFSNVKSIFGMKPHDPRLGFSSLDGIWWKKRRQLFHHNIMSQLKSTIITKLMTKYIKNDLFPVLDEIANENNENDENKDNVWYPNKDCKWISFSTIFNSFFGDSLPNKNDKNLLKYYDSLDIVINNFKCLVNFQNIPLLWLITMPTFRTVIKEFEIQQNILRSWAKEYNMGKIDDDNIDNDIQISKNSKNMSYLESLRYEMDNGKYVPTEDTIIADLTTSALAGTHTSATFMEQCIVWLAVQGVELQDIIYKEIKNAHGKFPSDHDSTEEEKEEELDILKNKSQLPALNAFIHEVLRCFPVELSNQRYLKQDYTITNFKDDEKNTYFFPKNTRIYANYFFMNHNKDRWKNPYQFNYKRFLDDNGKFQNDLASKYIVFGTGKRDCAGQNLILKEIYILLNVLITKYKFEAIDKNKIDVVNSDTMHDYLKSSNYSKDQMWYIEDLLFYVNVGVKVVKRNSKVLINDHDARRQEISHRYMSQAIAT